MPVGAKLVAPTATPVAPAPPIVPVEFCAGTTIPVVDGQPNGGCPAPAELCPGSTIPVVDSQPNGGCPVAATPTPAPVLAPTPAPIVVPTATAVPTPTAVPTAIPVPVAPGVLSVGVGGLGVSDPYVCGGGFVGTIAGGVAPYVLTYSIAGAGGVVDLGSFPVPTAGGYTSPPGFIDYSTVVDGVYTVSLTLSDSAVPPSTLVRNDFFTATITNVCGPPAPAPAPVSAPVAIVTSPASTGPLVTTTGPSVFTPTTVTPATPTVDAEPKQLALTGTKLDLTMWALMMIATGALIATSPWTRRNRRQT